MGTTATTPTKTSPLLEEARKAVASGQCPECSVSLSGRDGGKHAVAHYGADPLSRRERPTAYARQKALAEHGEKVQRQLAAAGYVKRTDEEEEDE